jgi:hypothetical protein
VETRLIEAGVDVVRTRTTHPDLVQRLLQLGVVVLIEGGGSNDFAVAASFEEAMQLLDREGL